jgi:hypothetical protein
LSAILEAADKVLDASLEIRNAADHQDANEEDIEYWLKEDPVLSTNDGLWVLPEVLAGSCWKDPYFLSLEELKFLYKFTRCWARLRRLNNATS